MINKNLDIIVFENDEKEIIRGLKKLNDGFNIIYRNLSSEFIIGKHNLSFKNYDSIIYNEDNNIMILLSNKSLFNIEDIINYLENKNLLVSIIDFKKKHEKRLDKKTPDICFANSKSLVEYYLMDSLEKGIYKCLYYPLTKSSISFGYKVRYDNLNDYIVKKYKGLIQLEDKMILIEDESLDNNLIKNIPSILENLGIKIKIMTKSDPDIYNGYEYKKLIKNLY